MKIEIWSDVVCPWCYIGKRRFETALQGFEHRDEVTVAWRSFELDPSALAITPGDNLDRLAAKYGMSRDQALASQARLTAAAAGEGLEFHLDRARSGNTFDAHRLLHHAAGVGLQDALEERLMAGYFTQAEPIGDRDVLVRMAVEVGLDGAASRAVLEGSDHADAVLDDEQQARELGITGVPFFVIDRAYGISGAQSPEMILSALRTAWAQSHPLQMVGATSADDSCVDDSCAI
jgi:predicted DsbA family dithiol-disulfide isomerase